MYVCASLLQKGAVARVTLSLASVVTMKSVTEEPDADCTFLPLQVFVVF